MIRNLVNSFYGWLYSFNQPIRNIVFLLILLLPLGIYTLLVGGILPPGIAMVYAVYLLSLIIGFVHYENKNTNKVD